MSGNSVLPSVLAPVSDLLKNARRATGTLPVAVELALEQHEEIADAIEARGSARARRAMSTHIESGVWALGQLKDGAGIRQVAVGDRDYRGQPES
jgi:GntR family transcriptional regulator, transcriptional repressor for pyruvate dehydrogenase complex